MKVVFSLSRVFFKDLVVCNVILSLFVFEILFILFFFNVVICMLCFNVIDLNVVLI